MQNNKRRKGGAKMAKYDALYQISSMCQFLAEKTIEDAMTAYCKAVQEEAASNPPLPTSPYMFQPNKVLGTLILLERLAEGIAKDTIAASDLEIAVGVITPPFYPDGRKKKK